MYVYTALGVRVTTSGLGSQSNVRSLLDGVFELPCQRSRQEGCVVGLENNDSCSSLGC